MTKIITKKEAIENGDKFYFTGKPCIRDHSSKRYVVNGVCIKCIQEYNADNTDGLRATAKKWRDAHPNYRKNIRKDKPGLDRHYDVICKMRKSGKLAPGADEKAIFKHYELAALLTIITGSKYEVDHIVPLNGETISGLHHENNLQVITASANRAKSNKYNNDNKLN